MSPEPEKRSDEALISEAFGLIRGELAAVIAAWYPNERGDVDEHGITKAGRCADRIWPSIKPLLDPLLAALAASRADNERLRDENRRLDDALDAVCAEADRHQAERDAARVEVSQLRAKIEKINELFAGGPDTSCRTVWDDGIECVSVPMNDLAAVLGVAAPGERPK